MISQSLSRPIGFYALLSTCLASLVFICGFTFFGVMESLSFSKTNIINFSVSGFNFKAQERFIRAHAVQNGETQEITLLISWSPDVETTASFKIGDYKSEGITVILRPSEGEIDPKDRPVLLYPSFLSGSSFAGPTGLIGRVFSPNSVYDGEILFSSKENPRLFAARCTQSLTTETQDYCLRDLRLGGGKIDATIRFPRQYLSDWQEIDKNVLAELETRRE